MNLNKVKGNAYYIHAPTNIGVYAYKSKNCLLIDTGINNTQARKLDEVLIQAGLHPKIIINTHHHYDHCGGNNYFQSTYPGCVVYSSFEESLYIENPDVYNNILFSSKASKDFDRNNKATVVNHILEYGINKIEDEKFEILALNGHSVGNVGIITPERVCFLGDSIFSDEIMDKYSIPYLFDIKESIETLKNIKNINADYFIISHSEKVMEREALISLADKNLENIDKYKTQIIELLEQPLTREDLLENLAVLNDLDMDFKHYHLNFSTVSAFIKLLRDEEIIEYSLENGKLYYYKKP